MYEFSAVEGTESMTPSARLLAALGLEHRGSAEVEDLYSRPVPRKVRPFPGLSSPVPVRVAA